MAPWSAASATRASLSTPTATARLVLVAASSAVTQTTISASPVLQDFMSLLTIFARHAQQTVSAALCSAAMVARTITMSLAISPAYPTANTPAQHAIHRQLQNARAASLAIPLTIHPFKTAT